MCQKVIYVGIDVDDVRYHGCGLDQRTGEVLDFHCRPTLKGLMGQLDKVREYFGAVQLKLCYEASYVGFSLQRDLKDRGYDCAAVADTDLRKQRHHARVVAPRSHGCDQGRRPGIVSDSRRARFAPPVQGVPPESGGNTDAGAVCGISRSGSEGLAPHKMHLHNKH